MLSLSSFHPNSNQCSKSEIDLFSVPDVQTDIIETITNTLHPINALTSDSAPIEYFIAGSGEHYVDPSSLTIFVRYKIVKKDNSSIDTTSHVSVENNLIGTMFSNVEIQANDVMISSNVNGYPYRSFFETLLNYSSDAKSSFLRSGGFYRNSTDTLLHFKVRKEYEIYGKIHADIAHQMKLLPNGINLKIKLTRSSNGFMLNRHSGDTEEYKISIIESYMTIRKVKLSATTMMRNENLLLRSTMKLPMERVICRQYTLSSGILNKRIANFSIGAVPLRVIFGLVKHDALNGSYEESGLKFQPFGIQSVECLLNGITHDKPYKLDFSPDTESLSTAYFKLHEMISGNDGSCSIGYDDFKTEQCLFGFTFSQDYTSGLCHEYINPTTQGSVSLVLEFKKALTHPVSVVMYLEYYTVIEIDKSRNVLVTF